MVNQNLTFADPCLSPAIKGMEGSPDFSRSSSFPVANGVCSLAIFVALSLSLFLFLPVFFCAWAAGCIRESACGLQFHPHLSLWDDEGTDSASRGNHVFQSCSYQPYLFGDQGLVHLKDKMTFPFPYWSSVCAPLVTKGWSVQEMVNNSMKLKVQ